MTLDCIVLQLGRILSPGMSIKTMVTGRQRQLIKQVGEYLVAAELCRRELIATSFTGNVPLFDILAITSGNKMKTIQVKTTSTNSGWNLNASDFLEFEKGKPDESQYIEGIRNLSSTNTIFCFVKLGYFGEQEKIGKIDEFYLVPDETVQTIVKEQYSAYLDKVNHHREKPNSYHIKIKAERIVQFKDNWNCLLE